MTSPDPMEQQHHQDGAPAPVEDKRSRCVFVGNLPMDVKEDELAKFFEEYGKVVRVDLKTPSRPPAYSFVEFDTPQAAEDAAAGRNGSEYGGNKIRVELSRGPGTGVPRGGLRGERSDRGGGGSDRGPPPPPRGGGGRGGRWRINVVGLPPGTSWQDLKDHFRPVCLPHRTDVFPEAGGDGRGPVRGMAEFTHPDDADRALRKLDDTEFRNKYGDRAYIRLYPDDGGRGGGGGGYYGGGGGGGGFHGGPPPPPPPGYGGYGGYDRGYDDRRGGGYDDRRGGGYDDRRGGRRERSYSPRRRSRSPPRGGGRGRRSPTPPPARGGGGRDRSYSRSRSPVDRRRRSPSRSPPRRSVSR